VGLLRARIQFNRPAEGRARFLPITESRHGSTKADVGVGLLGPQPNYLLEFGSRTPPVSLLK
jgi:hypothetical protein